MPQQPEPRYDVASAMAQGQRDYQEDALATDFQLGAGYGFAILSDGMGGHAAGDIASKIVVTEVFSELKLQSGDTRRLARELPEILVSAVQSANACVHAHAEAHPEAKGMGATLLAPVIIGSTLRWISVGDSPLFLFRRGRLTQLNEDHSLAPQIDLMVESGLMPADVGQNHPDRNALTSVLIGGPIERIDCPAETFALEDGDLILAASDGLQFLSNERITEILRDIGGARSAIIAEALMHEIEELDDPNQDNVTLSVIRFLGTRRGIRRMPTAEKARPAPVVAAAPKAAAPEVAASDAIEEPASFQRWRKGQTALMLHRRRRASGDGAA